MFVTDALTKANSHMTDVNYTVHEYLGQSCSVAQAGLSSATSCLYLPTSWVTKFANLSCPQNILKA